MQRSAAPYQSLCIKKCPAKTIQESINIQTIPSFKEGDLLISIQDFNFRQSRKLTSFKDNNKQVNMDIDRFKNNDNNVVPRLSNVDCVDFLNYFDKKFIEEACKQKLLFKKNKNLPLYKYRSDLNKKLALLDIDENTCYLNQEQRDLPIVQSWFEKTMLINNQFDMTVIFDFLIWDKMKNPVDLKTWLDSFEYELYLS